MSTPAPPPPPQPPTRPNSASPSKRWTGSIEDLLENNRRWASSCAAADASFFSEMASGQRPRYLWIGCSDSRVPANQIMGLPPGAVFVQRNVGNLATHKDLNAMSCLEYAVSVLKVEHVVVCGHHGCGAVAGALALGPAESSLVNLWVADIRDTRNLNLETLSALPPGPERVDRLVELNVVRQCFNVCTAPVVQAAWARGQKLAVHGLVYSLKDGLLRPLTDPVTGVAALQAHVDNEDEPGWPHATHHGHSRRSMDLEGWSGPPSSADLEATEAAAAAGTAEAAAGTKAAVTAAAEKTASTTTTMVGDVAAAMSAGARLGDNNGCASGGGSGGGSGGSDGASPLKEGSGGGRGGGDTAATTTSGGGGGASPHSPAASPPPPPAASRLPRPGSAAAIAAAVAGDAGSAATTATATASATANSPTAAAAGANNPSGRAVLPNSTACVATTTAALADGIAAHVAFASEDAAAAAEAKRAKEAREAAAATAGAAATGSSV